MKAVLFKGAHKSVGPFKVVVLPTRKKSDPSTAAVVVSKKVARTAVLRNRIRRRVFAVLSDVWPEVVATQSLQIVIVCYNKDIGDMSFTDLERDLLAALHHATKKLH